MAIHSKRKAPPESEDTTEPPKKIQSTDMTSSEETIQDTHHASPDSPASNNEVSTAALNTSSASQRFHDHQARFKALQARQSESRNQNRKETAAESKRLSTDPNLIHSLNRKHAIASHKLMKADAAAAGEDFERKRAWDWTVDESERWDRRVAKKEKRKEDVAFQDYRQSARKVYKRQIKEMGRPDMAAYQEQKAEAVMKAAESGRLEVVETDDGELVAVDRDGTFYSTAETTDFTQNKPDKAAVDRLVNDLKKAEDVRLKKRRERGLQEENGDVTFINEKNKVSLTFSLPVILIIR